MEPVGDILDALGVAVTQRDGDMIAGAVVLLKVVEPDGDVRLSVGWSEGMAWTERLGMLTSAQHTDLNAADAEDDEV